MLLSGFFSLLARKILKFLVFRFKKEPYISQILLKVWSIGSRTSCRPSRSVIILVQLNKLDSRHTLRYCHRPNWTPRSPVTITNSNNNNNSDDNNNMWNLSFGTPLFNGNLHSGDTKFGGPRKNVHIIFVFVTSVEETPLFRGRDTFAGSQNLPHLGDISI